jgi:hypothetical protein
MKSLVLLFAAGLFACAATPEDKPQSQASQGAASVDTAAILEEALVDLERAVAKHDSAALLVLLDPEYKSRVHDDFFKGRTEHFLNEFFCGKVVDSNQIFCQNFPKITAIRRMEIKQGPNSHQVSYRVKTEEREIESRITVSLEKGLFRGFIGSNGFTQVEK